MAATPFEPRNLIPWPPQRPSCVPQDINRQAHEKRYLRSVSSARWVPRAFLVPKPWGTGWRLIIDLRDINKHCKTQAMKMETLRCLHLIAKPNDYWVSFDPKDGFYALAIAPKDREAFTINIDEQLLQLCALPSRWLLSPRTFKKLTEVFTNYLRDPERPTNSSEGLLSPPTKARRK